MGTFNNKISAEFNPPRKWVLERALSYKNDEIDVKALEDIGIKCPAHRVSVKKGFVTDLASIPRMCWNIIAPWDIARAAIIHDYLYKSIRQYRAKLYPYDQACGHMEEPDIIAQAKKAADHVFLMGMLDATPTVSKFKVYTAYNAVVLFGKWSIMPRKDNI